MRVEVVLALAETQTLVTLELPVGSCAQEALQQSGLLARANASGAIGLGRFGVLITPNTQLKDGDRLELYRPLRISPAQARLDRVKSRQTSKKRSRNAL
jgi:hypothetical protein